jgi:DNA-directed RNA polymerase subunit RPC12/RpoP
MTEHECRFTKEIVCPYCGFVFKDSWDFDEDSGDIECSGCGKEFSFERNTRVTYCTLRKEAGDDRK